MRIIGGEFGGRKFYPPAKNWPTRPTTDFSKEGLYNILLNRIDFEKVVMLDLFGGTGNHCYEFISRGCQNATYVDRFHGCISFVKKISAELKIESKINIVKADVLKFIAQSKKSYDYIFAGPPYGMKELDTIPDRVFKNELLASNGLFVLEHNPNHSFEDHPNFEQARNYGSTIFSFFRNTNDLKAK